MAEGDLLSLDSKYQGSRQVGTNPSESCKRPAESSKVREISLRMVERGGRSFGRNPSSRNYQLNRFRRNALTICRLHSLAIGPAKSVSVASLRNPVAFANASSSIFARSAGVRELT